METNPVAKTLQGPTTPQEARQETQRHRRALFEGRGLIALGGGGITLPAVQAMLHSHTVIWLDVDVDAAWRRSANGDRPLARDRRRFTALHAERRPLYEEVADIVHPSSLGGTRHLSAAQFAHDQQDAIALVASQDGHFTVFAWSPCEGMVHAHRVEALLL